MVITDVGPTEMNANKEGKFSSVQTIRVERSELYEQVWSERIVGAASPSRFLERLMTPKPVVAPHLPKSASGEAFEDLFKIRDDVLRVVGVGLGSEAPEKKTAWSNRLCDLVDSHEGIDEVLPNVHCGDDVVARGRQTIRFQI